MTQVPLHFRSKTDDDLPFMVNSWMHSFRNGSDFAKSVPTAIYNRQHSQVVKSLIGKSFSVIACNPEDHTQIFGYAVFQPSSERIAVLHWIYVKATYRRLGVASAIWKQALEVADHDLKSPAAVTHLTHSFEWLGPKWNLIHNPYLIGSSNEAGTSIDHQLYQ